MEKMAVSFSYLLANAKQHERLGTKVEKGVFLEALGAPWGGLGRPWGPKSSPEFTF